MKLALKKFFNKDGKKYITIAITEYDGKEYYFANRVEEEKEDMVNEFNVFTIENNEIEYVKDNNLINKLLPIFEENLKKEIEKIMKGDNE